MTNRGKYFVAIVLSSFFSLSALNGCSSGAAVNSERYSLVDGITSASMDRDYKVTTKVYGMLGDGALVVKTSDVGLRSAVHHKWSSKLEEQLSLIMKDALIRHSAAKNIEVAVVVKDFSGSTSGEVYIDAFIEARKGKQRLMKAPFAYHGRQSGQGYPALVSELKAGWSEICEQAVMKIISEKSPELCLRDSH